ncbi:MFS transporter [Streptomyces sp. B3I8]|uniref:MFS transporter n=1 Tax=Streptomyces sp. B3I8 TaxID=3042303 RepID=UPI002784AD94|nr:MFS family permease [Streptomyces sp. B3I8]
MAAARPPRDTPAQDPSRAGEDRCGGPGRVRGSARRIGRALHFPVTGTYRGIRRATHAQGAGESGLAKLIELHAVNGAGDVMVTVALASTVFFSVPTDEARGRVALYLAITMAPFTVLAPVIGPLLDRLPHGRRAAMAAAMLARALLALLLSGAVATGSLELYPAALGVLVASKAYGVVRSAVVPRLLPPAFSLVKANSRVTLGGLLATGVAAPIGAGLQALGPRYPLYGAFLIFVGGTFLSFSLPRKVDSAKGEHLALLAARNHGPHRPHRPHEDHGPHGAQPPPPDTPGPPPGSAPTGTTPSATAGSAATGSAAGSAAAGSTAGSARDAPTEYATTGKAARRRPGLRTVGSTVIHALTANASLRCLSGFLIFFLAFLLREQPLAGSSAAVSLGIVGVAAGTGNALGTMVGAWLKARGPEVIIVTVVAVVLAVAITAAVFFGTVLVACLAAFAGCAQALGKLSLDALIQRDVPEEVRTSAFARSETSLQMAWVLGGAIGIVLPLNGVLGMSVGAAIVATGLLATVHPLWTTARRGPHVGTTSCVPDSLRP